MDSRATVTAADLVNGLSERELAELFWDLGEEPQARRFARAIVGEGTRARIIPIATAEYPTPSSRPAYGVLNTGKFERTFGLTLPHWQTALQSCVTSPAEPPNSPAVG